MLYVVCCGVCCVLCVVLLCLVSVTSCISAAPEESVIYCPQAAIPDVEIAQFGRTRFEHFSTVYLGKLNVLQKQFFNRVRERKSQRINAIKG